MKREFLYELEIYGQKVAAMDTKYNCYINTYIGNDNEVNWVRTSYELFQYALDLNVWITTNKHEKDITREQRDNYVAMRALAQALTDNYIG